MASRQPAEDSQPAASAETGGALESVGTFVSGLEAGTGNVSGQVGNGSQQGNGDLFNMPPIEPLNLAALERGNSSDVPGLRRVVVSEGSEELMPDQGALAGPVGGLATVTPPQGRPITYGPMGGYPCPMGHPAFPQGGMEFPPNFDPRGMMMPPVPPALGWYGTPMLNRPMGIGTGGNGVNPFWTPGTQARANQGVENQPSGARRVLEGSFNQVGEGMNSGMNREENGETERQNGLEGENGNPPVGDPLSWFRGQVNSGQKDLAGVVTDPVELFRIRCLREAEQKFTAGWNK